MMNIEEYDESNQALVSQVGEVGENPISDPMFLRRGERRKNTTPISSTVSGVSDSSPRGLVETSHWPRGNLSWEHHLYQVTENI